MNNNTKELKDELTNFLYEYENSEGEFEEIAQAVLGAYGRVYDGQPTKEVSSSEGELVSINGVFFTKRYLYSKILYKCGYIALSEMLMNDPQRIVDRNNGKEKLVLKQKPQKK